MRFIVSVSLIVAGLIHLPPLVGVFGQRQLESAYDVEVAEANLLVLLRHRAVLLGLVGSVLIAAAFVPSLQSSALALGLASAGTFLWLTWSTPGTNAHLSKVFAADVVALVCLLIGLGAHLVLHYRG